MQSTSKKRRSYSAQSIQALLVALAVGLFGMTVCFDINSHFNRNFKQPNGQRHALKTIDCSVRISDSGNSLFEAPCSNVHQFHLDFSKTQTKRFPLYEDRREKSRKKSSGGCIKCPISSVYPSYQKYLTADCIKRAILEQAKEYLEKNRSRTAEQIVISSIQRFAIPLTDREQAKFAGQSAYPDLWKKVNICSVEQGDEQFEEINAGNCRYSILFEKIHYERLNDPSFFSCDKTLSNRQTFDEVNPDFTPVDDLLFTQTALSEMAGENVPQGILNAKAFLDLLNDTNQTDSSGEQFDSFFAATTICFSFDFLVGSCQCNPLNRIIFDQHRCHESIGDEIVSTEQIPSSSDSFWLGVLLIPFACGILSFDSILEYIGSTLRDLPWLFRLLNIRIIALSGLFLQSNRNFIASDSILTLKTVRLLI